jgi:twitching motility protein PilT
MNTINHDHRNLVTIEDPVEYQLQGINQVEVDTHIGLTFSEGLRSTLRQDPDVIMVGEIRDSDTARNAIRAAMTGHLVFSTLHTTDATQTISRILSFYPPHQHHEVRMLLSTALQAVVSLRLVPRADGRGRVPAAEVLINTATVADNIRDIERALHIPDLIAGGAVSYGMQTFDQSLMKWYKEGAISYESALFYSTNPNELALRVSGVDSASDRKFDEVTGDSAQSQPLDLTP